MITLKNINLSSIDLSGIDLRGIKLGLGGRGGGSGDGFPQLPGDVTRWHFGGLTNEMMAAMDDPRIEDADHKGRFLSFKNFAWKGMSGAGGYNQNFNQWGYGNLSTATQTHTSYKIELSVPSTLKTANIYSNANSIGKEGDIYDFTLNIVGLKDGASLRITKGVVSGVIEMIEKDGIYKIYQPIEAGWDQSRIYIFISNPNLIDLNITIEQLPLYPGALVFDGVDDCGTCDNFPILTKEKGYTVVALRQWIDNQNNDAYLLSNAIDGVTLGAFVFERNKNSRTYNFGNVTAVSVNYNPITYQTSNRYNSIKITAGTILEGNDVLLVGTNYKTGANLYANAAIWELVFLDHDATEEELIKIKDYFVKTYPWLFPDQAWTVTGKTNEDEDRATIANITGNGNDLVLSNFGFSGNSGYGSYVYNFNDTSTWIYYSYNGTTEITSSTIHVTEVKTARPFLEKNTSSGGYNKMKIKVTGIKDGEILKFMSDEDRDNTINIEKDGIYSLPGSDKLYYGFRLSNSTNTYPFNCDITIEQIPDLEGYLVTDGVDDRVQDSSFKLNKDWTLVGEWVFLNQKATNAGITKPFSFVVYNRTTGLSLFINTGTSGITIENVKSIKAICSDGRIYLDDWSEMLISKDQDITSSTSVLSIGFNGTAYTQMAFKNLGIYNNQLLSKEDCIKAYNYLQTLKAK